jgi:uncharacterized protein YycO
MIRFQFVLGRGLSSQAIAWYSSGHFSHVDALLPDGTLLGARSDTIGRVPPGVQMRPAFYETWKERVVMCMDCTYEQETRFWDFLKSQIGKPYDMTAIWGFLAGRDWRDEDSWYCSELLTAAIEESGVCPVLYTPRNKVTPAGLATVTSALGGWTT